ncbi:MAG: endopeptidase La [Acidobacteriota bacterium]
MTKKSNGDTPEEAVKLPDLLPVLPLKDAVVFPYIIVPLSVGRDKSVLAVDQALADNRTILLVAQKDSNADDPGAEGLHELGTAAVIMRMLKLPDGRIRILVQGLARVRVEHISQTEPFLQAKIQKIEEVIADPSTPLESEALVRSVKESLDRAVTLGKSISPEVMVIAANLDDPGRLADLAASNIDLKVDEAQAILATADPIARLKKVSDLVQRELQLLTMQQEISSQARGEMDRSQREYFLRQQLKAIQSELGEGEELSEEVANYRKLLEEKKLPEEAHNEAEKQIKRLERSHPDSAETSILRTYLDWLTGLPWSQESPDLLDLPHARKVLDEDHYDLEKIKERILEHLAVRKLKNDTKGPILCFVGPPGVGKTSLGRSIARAMGRKFVRISLGGVRDEAEVRGHRRTYVGALPGRIIQGIQQAGTSNPVFMLDEIDKLGADYRGDPSSALLEVLDPEQNWSFRDHYLSVAYDLSKVMFITTANMLDPIQPAFLDRMEVIRLSGYTEEEKLFIARRHLIPKQMAEHGLTDQHVSFTEPGIMRIISSYTREAGLRNLEREIGAVCRKIAVRVASGKTGRVVVTPKRAERYLGVEKHRAEELLQQDRVGVATGLAWTAAGGDLLFIEVVAVPGKGLLLLTGQLGEVMKESAQAALSFARAYAARLGISDDFFAKHDVHVHVPAGSIPKDGPSAGITIATAIISVLTGRAVHRRVAMTGEITLRGDVMPIGGLKEKILAAKLAGVTTVLIPKLNERELPEIPGPVKKGLTFHFVDHVEQVLEYALLPSASQAAPTSAAPAANPPRLAVRSSKRG